MAGREQRLICSVLGTVLPFPSHRPATSAIIAACCQLQACPEPVEGLVAIKSLPDFYLTFQIVLHLSNGDFFSVKDTGG